MKAGIIGYGKMGRNIFNLFGETSMEVTVLGRDPAETDRQNARLEKRLRRAVSTGMLDGGELPRRLAALRFTTSWDDLHDCDVVVETVTEDLETKIAVLRRAEETISPQAVLTSNTSTLSVTRLAESLRNPARFCGFHFFHPIQLTSIVEILTARQTAPHVVEFLRRISREIGRTPLVMRDLAGSCINVPLLWHTCEMLYLLEQGVASPSRVDAIVGRFARVGPCDTLDTIGIPFFTGLLRRTIDGFAFDLTIPELLHKMSRDGRFGKYANRGVYIYRDDRPADDAPEYYAHPAQTHTPSGARSDDEGLHERLLFPVYFAMLTVAQMNLGNLGDLSFGISDVIGLKLNPMEEMQKLGSEGLRKVFDRLRDELGPRYDCSPLADVMASLDNQ